MARRDDDNLCKILYDVQVHHAGEIPSGDKFVAQLLVPKKFFYISGIVSLVILGRISGFIEYGHANYAGRIIAADLHSRRLRSRLER